MARVALSGWYKFFDVSCSSHFSYITLPRSLTLRLSQLRSVASIQRLHATRSGMAISRKEKKMTYHFSLTCQVCLSACAQTDALHISRVVRMSYAARTSSRSLFARYCSYAVRATMGIAGSWTGVWVLRRPRLIILREYS